MDAQAGTFTDAVIDVPPGCVEAHHRAVMLHQSRLLGRLADVAMSMAERAERLSATLEAEQTAEPKSASSELASEDDAPQPEPPRAAFRRFALDFDRHARTARLCFLVQSKILDEVQRRDRDVAYDARIAAEKAATREREALAKQEHARKGSIQTIVERIAEAEHPDDADQVEGLVDAACGQLRDRDRFGDILKRPISEIIDLICRDLGLSPDWPRLAGETWARDEIASGEVGPPFLPALRGEPIPKVRKRRPPRHPEQKPMPVAASEAPPPEVAADWPPPTVSPPTPPEPPVPQPWEERLGMPGELSPRERAKIEAAATGIDPRRRWR